MTVKNSKSSKASVAKGLIAGLKKNFPKGSETLNFGGTSIAVADLTTNLESIVNNRQTAVMAQAAAKEAVSVEDAQAPALYAQMSAFEQFVRVTFGNAASSLAEFDLALPKARTPMTAETAAIAVAKRKATREARGTKGPKAKLAVKGAITASLVVTPVAESAPSALATPPVAAPSGNTTPTGR